MVVYMDPLGNNVSPSSTEKLMLGLMGLPKAQLNLVTSKMSSTT